MDEAKELPLRVIIAGGRDFNDYELLQSTVDGLLRGKDNIEIVSGHANGADLLGELYAVERELKCTVFKANWELYKRKAGPIRNSQMLDYARQGRAMLIAFWDGVSRGTADTIGKAKRLGVECHIVSYSAQPKA